MEEKVEQIIKFIKNDDLENFSNIIEENRLFTLSIGKYPLLTLFYMYESRKLLKKYKDRLFRITEYNVIKKGQQNLYDDFRHLAGRSIRFYLDDEIVSPFEMLMIKGDILEFDKYYKRELVTDKQQLKIEKINEMYTGYHTEDEFIPAKRELIGQRKNIIQISIVLMLVTIFCAMFSGIYGIVLNSSIKKDSIQQVSTMSTLKYAIKHNIDSVIVKDFSVNMYFWKTIDLNSNIEGNGHTIYIKGKVDKAFINILNSNIENVNFVYEENKINKELITIVSREGSLSNCKFTYKNIKSLDIKDNLSFIVLANRGNITKINIDFNGEIKIKQYNEENYKYITLLLKENYGLVSEINVVENLKLVGCNTANYNFATIAQYNYLECEIKNIIIKNSRIESTYIDLAGIIISNQGNLIDSNISIDISNSNGTAQWYPNVAGVVLENNSYINNIVFSGNIEIDSLMTSTSVVSAGICIKNNGEIKNCITNGENIVNIKVRADDVTESRLSGIACINYNTISDCKNNMNLTANVINSIVHMAGISSINYYTEVFYIYLATIKSCINEANIEFNHQDTLVGDNYIGGICGYTIGNVSSCVSITKFDVIENEKMYIGALIGGLSNINYDSYIDTYYLDNIYYTTSSNIFGVCGYYNEKKEHQRYDQDFASITKYSSIEEIKNNSLYWG